MDLSPDRKLRVPDIGVPTALLEGPLRFDGRAMGDLRVGTLVFVEGRLQRIEPSDGPPRRILLPGLAEAHVHLDKCHTIDRCDRIGGDLAAAIAAQRRDKPNWTAEDLKSRARRGLSELQQAGCRVVRNHVDWPGGAEAITPPLAWDVLRGLKAEAKAAGIELQLAALTAVDDMADASVAEAVARRMADDGGVLGAFVFDQPQRRAGLRNLFRMADRFGLALDFHVDEGLAPTLDGLEMIAEVAAETGFQGPVLCGHACSLASRSADDLARIADKLAGQAIHVAALPATNLYLQGRRPGGTPDRRGLTMLSELAAAGVPTVIGTDNVRDAFLPIGRHDPLNSLSLAVLGAHLDPPFGRHLPMITTTARSALGLPVATLDALRIDDMLLVEGSSLSDVLTPGVARRPLGPALKGEDIAR